MTPVCKVLPGQESAELIMWAQPLDTPLAGRHSGGNKHTKTHTHTRGQTAEARRTTILKPVEQKSHPQKARQDEKAEGYIPDEGTT